jgi:hypothetical protein
VARLVELPLLGKKRYKDCNSRPAHTEKKKKKKNQRDSVSKRPMFIIPATGWGEDKGKRIEIAGWPGQKHQTFSEETLKVRGLRHGLSVELLLTLSF